MKIEMNEEWRKRWVAALRSGEYRQAQMSLRDGNRFCCLGVLCDLSRVGHWDGDGNYVVDEGKNGGLAPVGVVELVGLQDNAERDTQRRISTLNDEGATFAQIADMIERGEFATVELGEDE
jgi:hypothetical protein